MASKLIMSRLEVCSPQRVSVNDGRSAASPGVPQAFAAPQQTFIHLNTPPIQASGRAAASGRPAPASAERTSADGGLQRAS